MRCSSLSVIDSGDAGLLWARVCRGGALGTGPSGTSGHGKER